MRAYSPMETIGGGMILDANPSKHSHADDSMVESFQVKEAGEPKDIVESYLMQAKDFVDHKEIIEKLSVSEKELVEIKNNLQEEGKILAMGNHLIHMKNMENLADKAVQLLDSYHEQNSLKKGISREEFKSRMKISLRTKDYDMLIEELTKMKPIVEDKAILKKADFEITYSPEQEKIKRDILDRLKKEGLEPSLVKDYIDTPTKQTVMDGLMEQDLIVRVSDELIYDKKTIEKLTEEVKEILKSQNEISMNDIRDRYNLSRKFSIALLEYYDRIKITRRVGDKRLPM